MGVHPPAIQVRCGIECKWLRQRWTQAPWSKSSADSVEVAGIRKVSSDSAAVAVEFLGNTAAFILGEESVLFVGADGEECRIRLHGGAILSSSRTRTRLATAGDDGCVMTVDVNGDIECLFADERGRWADHVAATSEGTVAWSVGRRLFVRGADGAERVMEVVSSVGGLAFSPGSGELAVSRYNGVTLWRHSTDEPPVELSWKGSHLEVAFSPDREVLVTAMREPTLHAWNLRTKADLPMPGFPARVELDGLDGRRPFPCRERFRPPDIAVV